MRRGDMVSQDLVSPSRRDLYVETLCSPSAIWRGTEAVSALTHALLILFSSELSTIFFLGFRQWRSRADRFLTLNTNIRLPLFWSTRSRAQGQDSAKCADLAHGRDYSDCRASKEMSKKCLDHELSKTVENEGLLRGFFQPQTEFSVVSSKYLQVMLEIKQAARPVCKIVQDFINFIIL